MPPRTHNDFFHLAERQIRNCTMTFENGNRIEILDANVTRSDEMPIIQSGLQEITFKSNNVDIDDLNALAECAARRHETHFRAATEVARRVGIATRDAMDAISYCASVYANAGRGFIDTLNEAWASIGGDYELRDEEDYVESDPISYDELMGGDAEW